MLQLIRSGRSSQQKYLEDKPLTLPTLNSRTFGPADASFHSETFQSHSRIQALVEAHFSMTVTGEPHLRVVEQVHRIPVKITAHLSKDPGVESRSSNEIYHSE